MTWTLYLSDQANHDIDEIWQYGFDHYDLTIANDYDLLIEQALQDVLENPFRMGAKEIQGYDNKMYSYHLRHSNSRAQGDIKQPRHTIIYFLLEANIIAVASIAPEISAARGQ